MKFHVIYQVNGISGHQLVCVGCARVCAGVHGCAGLCMCMSVHGCGQCGRVCAGVGGCAWIGTGVCVCVWDEFSEFLPENRLPTSADFNTYPIQIFLSRGSRGQA